jgi:hypothetical protein
LTIDRDSRVQGKVFSKKVRFFGSPVFGVEIGVVSDPARLPSFFYRKPPKNKLQRKTTARLRRGGSRRTVRLAWIEDFPYLEGVEVHFTPEQETQLSQIATHAGTDAERLKDAALRLTEEESRFHTL